MGGLIACPENPKHHKLKCLSCTSRLKAGHRWLGKKRVKLKRMYNLSDKQRKIIETMLLQPISCWDDLKSIKIDGDDIGDASFSELAGNLRETKPDFKKNINYAIKLLENALIVHFSILNCLKKERPDKFILFNGRISSYRPALRVSVSLGINTYVLETHFTNYDRYILTNNSYSHDPSIITKEIFTAYNHSKHTENKKHEIAFNWYNDREHGNKDKQVVFTGKKIKGTIPNDLITELNDSRLKIGMFITSEFELVDESKNPFYETQNAGIAQITEDLNNEKILFIVRAHPNLKKLNNSQIKELQDLGSTKKNIIYISPESKTNTYELIDCCDIVLTFGSTVGIEAVHKGKPTILMGKAIYQGFGGTIEPKSHKELVKILKESAKIGQIPKKYMPQKKAMEHAATIYAYGILESGIKQKYQKLKTFIYPSGIEKNNIITHIKPQIIYRITDRIYWVPWFLGRIIKRLSYELKKNHKI